MAASEEVETDPKSYIAFCREMSSSFLNVLVGSICVFGVVFS